AHSTCAGGSSDTTSAVGFSCGIDCKPVRMRLVKRLEGTTAVHARKHHQSIRMSRTHKITIEILTIQKSGLVLERLLARIKSHDPSGINHNPLCLGSFPVAPPPCDVVMQWIQFRSEERRVGKECRSRW